MRNSCQCDGLKWDRLPACHERVDKLEAYPTNSLRSLEQQIAGRTLLPVILVRQKCPTKMEITKSSRVSKEMSSTSDM